MFDGLHKYMGENFYPNLINEVNGNYAVEQYPFIAFQDIKLEGTNDYEQIFIGLYAAGADKGDKGYFGFNDPRVKDKAIRLEGTDHIKGVGFNYPWRVNGVRNIRYNHGKEAFRPADGSVQSALPVEKASGKRRWKCTVCGYEAEGEVPPDECPLCHQGADRFEEVK